MAAIAPEMSSFFVSEFTWYDCSVSTVHFTFPVMGHKAKIRRKIGSSGPADVMHETKSKRLSSTSTSESNSFDMMISGCILVTKSSCASVGKTHLEEVQYLLWQHHGRGFLSFFSYLFSVVVQAFKPSKTLLGCLLVAELNATTTGGSPGSCKLAEVKSYKFI